MLRLLNFRCSFCSNPLDETHSRYFSERKMAEMQDAAFRMGAAREHD